ncbi:hypothetical protein EV424DRAFT_1018272 [Suillus variegatus]|nr:hypothetical protein EV424DRAFT_1018272 [Suillus variegatus]
MTSTMLKLRTVPNCVHPISRPSAGQFHCLADDLHPLSLTFFLGHVNLGFVSAFSCLMLSCLTSLLLQHFLHGECLASDTRSKHRDYTACYMLMSADTSAILSDNLWTVAQSICSDLDSVCHQEDCRRRTVCLLNIFRSWGAYEAVSKSSHSLFSKAEHMSRTSGMLWIVMMIFLIGEPTDLECRIYKFIF